MKIDVRILLFTNVLMGILVFFVQNRHMGVFSFVIALLLIILAGLYREAINYIVFYIILRHFGDFLSLFGNNGIFMYIDTVAFMILAVFPLTMIGTIMVKTIRINEFISALEQMKVSKNIIIALAVAFSYIPTLKEEYFRIKENMKLRGIELNIISFIKNPLENFEYFLVPLLFRSIKLADELTLSALVKGVENDNKRSSYYLIKLKITDYLIGLFILISSAIFTVYII
ncbi:MAG: energy-coupling factor transporter transmembrane protein EcfT [Fusobacteriaceae bacterium]|nr:energy-coupling factor transporter transmembrane protein EcfT [Fusobacteriaceae bacterium]